MGRSSALVAVFARQYHPLMVAASGLHKNSKRDTCGKVLCTHADNGYEY